MKTSLANRLSIYWLVVSSFLYLTIVIQLLAPNLTAALVFNSPLFVLKTLIYLLMANKFQAFLTPILLIFFAIRIEKFQNREKVAVLMTINWALWAISFGIVFLLTD